MCMTTELAQRMKAAGLKATEGPWIIFDDGWSDDEDAVINNEARDDACASPIAVIKGGGSESCANSPFYAEQRANAEHIATSCPENVVALVEALEARDKQIAELRVSNRILCSDAMAKQDRITELEAQTFKVEMPEAFYPDGDTELSYVLQEDEVIAAIVAAGGTPIAICRLCKSELDLSHRPDCSHYCHSSSAGVAVDGI